MCRNIYDKTLGKIVYKYDLNYIKMHFFKKRLEGNTPKVI